MNKKEFAIIADTIRTYYPKENILSNAQAVSLWYEQLKDLSYEVAAATINKWVSINKWAPTIADIREGAAGLIYGEAKTWGEAWDDTIKAIHAVGLYDVTGTLDRLDDTTRKVVKQIGVANICMSDNGELNTIRAHFKKMYEAEIERQKHYNQMSPQLKKNIEALQLDKGDTIPPQ